MLYIMLTLYVIVGVIKHDCVLNKKVKLASI